MRKPRRSACVTLLLLVTAAAPGWAQAPVRDTNARPDPGRPATGFVAGVVVSDDVPARPLRRATVNLISPDLSVPLSAVTDDTGHFAFDGVPAGTYGLSASKAGWVGAFFGSTRPGHGPGVPLAVQTGARVADLVLPLTHGSVITGTLRLPSGRPAENMTVFVTGVETTSGRPRLRLSGGQVVTDDRGQYRIYGLPAGNYVVQARPSGFLTGVPSDTTDAPQTTPAEVSWAREVARTRPGRAPAATAGPAHGRTMAYATVFFPGTTDPGRATIVSVGAGEERRGVDFPMVIVPTARVSGVVSGPDGLPLADARVTLNAFEEAPDVVALLSPREAIRSAADGSFTLKAVPPGHYRLSARRPLDARAASAPSRPNGASAAVQTMAAAGSGEARSAGELWADQDLIVGGEDLSAVNLFMQPGLSLSGQVIFDAATLEPPSPDDLAHARVTLTPVQGGASMSDVIASAVVGAVGTVAADRTFVVNGIVPGRYRLSVSMPGVRSSPAAAGRGWVLRSAVLHDTDMADAALRVEAGADLSGATVTFTDRAAEFVGSLTNAANRPVSGFPIVVFSTDRSDWRIGSRRIAVARPATDGTFRLFGLPSGTYYVAAAVDLVQADLDDPAFYEQLLPGALPITLTEGARVVQNLRLAR